MLVKKIDPSWAPAENKDLMVGETINIDHPDTLIAEGKVVPVDETAKEEKKEKTLEEMTKKELLKYALEKKIVVDTKMTNKQMIEVIKEAESKTEVKSPEGDQN